MNVPNIVKCSVCGAKTNIKIQLGYLNDFFIAVPCLKCGSILKGVGHLDAPNFSFKFEDEQIFNNKINDYSFYVEYSAELIVQKPKALLSKDDAHFPPFFINVNLMESVVDNSTFEVVPNYLNYLLQNWGKISNEIRLFLNKEYSILVKYLREKNSNNFSNEIEFCFYKHMHYRHTFNMFDKTAKCEIKRELIDFETKYLELEKNKIDEFLYVLEEKDYLNKLDLKIFKLVDKFVSKSTILAPALTAQFFNKNIDYNNLGVVTCVPDDLVDLYQDFYEVECLFIPILECLNNIMYRGKYDKYKSSKMTLEKSMNRTKGKMIQDFDTTEVFSNNFYCGFNSIIRNSIGHSDFYYDSIRQFITFKDLDKEYSCYLLEFMLECVNAIYGLIKLENVLYYLQRSNYIRKGLNSCYLLTEFERKIERNKLCLCGSGKKYKKCHYLNNKVGVEICRN